MSDQTPVHMTVLEEHDDAIVLSCPCGQIFEADAYGTNTCVVGRRAVSQCPNCKRLHAREVHASYG